LSVFKLTLKIPEMYDKISKVTDISLVNDKISMYRKNYV